MQDLDPFEGDQGHETVFRDVIFLALAGFVAVVLLLLPHVHPPKEAEAAIRSPGNVIVEMHWPSDMPVDVDLWVQAPNENPVGFWNMGGPTFNLLRDDRWYVVRNMAELLGQLGLESAIPQLAKTLEHPEARVRRSAAGALAKIGTQPTVDLLRRALKDSDLETRKVIARSIEGPKSVALAMPLVLATEDQDDLGLIEECYLALGRIGTSDAVQALIIALPPGGLFSRKPPGPRIAAVKALRNVGSDAALAALKALKKDPDKAVRAELAKALGS